MTGNSAVIGLGKSSDDTATCLEIICRHGTIDLALTEIRAGSQDSGNLPITPFSGTGYTARLLNDVITSGLPKQYVHVSWRVGKISEQSLRRSG